MLLHVKTKYISLSLSHLFLKAARDATQKPHIYYLRFISKRTFQPNVQKSAWENNQT